jgi:hypothetical protein
MWLVCRGPSPTCGRARADRGARSIQTPLSGSRPVRQFGSVHFALAIEESPNRGAEQFWQGTGSAERQFGARSTEAAIAPERRGAGLGRTRADVAVHPLMPGLV